MTRNRIGHELTGTHIFAMVRFMRFVYTLVCLCFVACSSNSGDPTLKIASFQTAEPLNESDKEQIVARILESQRAGFISHDLHGYLKVWSQEAQLIGGRSAETGKYDLVLSLPQIKASKKLAFVGESQMVSFEPSEVVVSGDSSQAVLQWKLLQKNASSAFLVGERYKLRSSPEGWMIVENRYWILAQ